MKTVNKQIVLGYVGAEPELKSMPNGTSVLSFSVATSDDYKDKSGKVVERTDWHRVVVYGKLADLASGFLQKGSGVYVEGKSKTRTYTPQGGEKRYITELIAGEVSVVSNGKAGATAATNAAAPMPDHFNEFPEDDDFPF